MWDCIQNITTNVDLLDWSINGRGRGGLQEMNQRPQGGFTTHNTEHINYGTQKETQGRAGRAQDVSNYSSHLCLGN